MVEITGIFHEILISWRPPSQMTSCQLRIWGRILGGSNSLTPHFLNLWVKFVYGHFDTVCWVIHKSKAWECASFSHIVLIEIFVSFPCSVFFFFFHFVAIYPWNLATLQSAFDLTQQSTPIALSLSLSPRRKNFENTVNTFTLQKCTIVINREIDCFLKIIFCVEKLCVKI